MIVIEDRLNLVLSKLKPVNGFQPIFKYGDNKELKAFLRVKAQANKKPYPLIWLVYPFVEEQKKNYVYIDKITLVLATNTNAQMLNDERLVKTYKGILIPLLEDMQKVFMKSNIIFVKDESYKITKFPNYGENDQHEQTDIWDALKVTVDMQISNNCSN